MTTLLTISGTDEVSTMREGAYQTFTIPTNYTWDIISLTITVNYKVIGAMRVCSAYIYTGGSGRAGTAVWSATFHLVPPTNQWQSVTFTVIIPTHLVAGEYSDNDPI